MLRKQVRGTVMALSLLGVVGLPAVARAQPTTNASSETIRGTITRVDTVNHFMLSDDRGFTDDVTLRAGASVSSSGVRLEPGQRVTIVGANGGSTFVADRISADGAAETDRPDAAAVAPASPPADPVYEGPDYYPVAVAYPVSVYGPYYGGPFYSGLSVAIGFGGGYYHGGYGGYYHGGYGGYYHGGYGGYYQSGDGGYYHGGYRGGYGSVRSSGGSPRAGFGGRAGGAGRR